MLRLNYKNILVTGGAGFIGSFLVDELIKRGHKVRIFDNLDKQVHQGKIPPYLNKKVEFIKGDVRNYEALKKTIKGIDVIFNFAAVVGVAQSNYEIKRFIDVNIGGTANLIDILVNTKNKVKKIIGIASMTSLGEGNYKCKKCGIVRPALRSERDIKKNGWEPVCPKCKGKIIPVTTNEDVIEYPNSIYSITKKAQQDLLMLFGKTYNIPTIIMRGFNIYGPRQSLSNPYTGVTSIFMSRVKNNQPAIVYEDGNQTRDFIFIKDVVEAFVLALYKDDANYQVFNLGSGSPIKIREIAQKIASLLGKPELVKITMEFRKNDIRHCFADISKIKELLGWYPKTSLEEGLTQLIKWGSKGKAEDKFEKAESELKHKGLLKY